MNLIINIIDWINTQRFLVKNSLVLFKTEAKLAFTKLLPLLCCLCLLLALLTTLCIGIQAFIVCLLSLYIQNVFSIIGLTILINLIAIGILYYLVKQGLQHLSFPKSREFFSASSAKKKQLFLNLERENRLLNKRPIKAEVQSSKEIETKAIAVAALMATSYLLLKNRKLLKKVYKLPLIWLAYNKKK